MYHANIATAAGMRFATPGETSQIVRETTTAKGGLVLMTASGNEVISRHVMYVAHGELTTVIAAHEYLARWPMLNLLHIEQFNRFEFELAGWTSEHFCEAAGLFTPVFGCKPTYAQSNFDDQKLLLAMNLWLRE